MIDSFVAPVLMALEMLAADFLFGSLLTKRKHFRLRAVTGSIVVVECVVLFCALYFLATGGLFSYSAVDSVMDSVCKFVLYLFIFVMTVVCLAFCYGNSVWIVLFYCAGGYAMQHISVNLSCLLRIIPAVGGAAGEMFWLTYLLDAGACAVVYALVWVLFVRGKSLPASADVKSKVVVSVFVIIICIGLSRLKTDDPSRGTVAYLAETLYAIVSCSLILFNLFNLTANDSMRDRVDTVTDILRREREQYKTVRENIDLINIKCHDLKHQITALRQDYSEKELDKLERAVMIYDAVVKTGNEILDTILTEKSLYCESHHIHLTCMVHAEALTFMEDMDVYSLFGNALSNAIECVSKIGSETRRVISMTVQTAQKFLSIHIENFFDGELRMKDGLPETDKDGGYHGYGMRSMALIAKKYNGSMSVTTEGDKFRLDFLFPVPET